MRLSPSPLSCSFPLPPSPTLAIWFRQARLAAEMDRLRAVRVSDTSPLASAAAAASGQSHRGMSPSPGEEDDVGRASPSGRVSEGGHGEGRATPSIPTGPAAPPPPQQHVPKGPGGGSFTLEELLRRPHVQYGERLEGERVADAVAGARLKGIFLLPPCS